MKNILSYDRFKLSASYLVKVIDKIPVGLLLSIPFVVMILITKLNFHLIADEGIYHIKVIEYFADIWPRIDIGDYPSASTPLAYLLLTIFGKIIGFEIWKLRLLPAIATYLSVYLFYGLCKQHKLPHPLLSSFIFLFFPYVFFYGLTIYPASFALFFGLWAMNYYLLSDTTLNQLIKGSILATLAIYCRQFYLVLPLGMLLFELWQAYRQGFFRSIRQRFLRLIVLAIPIMMFLPLFILWGGFTAPFNQASQGGAWYFKPMPHHINYFFMLVGFYFLPTLIKSDMKELMKSKLSILFVLVILLPLYFLFPIIFSYEPGQIDIIAGLIVHGLGFLRQILGNNVAFIATLSLWTVGFLILMGELMSRPWSVDKRKLIVLLVTFLTLITLTPYVYERYYILLIPFLILLFHKSFHSRRLLILWLAAQVVLSTGFSYWQIALK